ncbi:MAG: sensor histidine kinase [Propionibacteriaceae bacterium]|nr:sensor histidine kinase [Propionibacteriaceae bacterium]
MTNARLLSLPRPRALDIALASLLGLFLAFFTSLAPGGGAGAMLLSLVWSLMYTIPLLWRRADADLATLLVIPAHVIQLLVSATPHPGNVTVPLLMFAVAAHGRLKYRLWWLGFGVAAALAAAIDWNVGTSWSGASLATTVASIIATFVGLAAIVSAAWAIGAFARARSDAHAASRDALTAQTLQHQQAIALAANEERQRLAREMHDVVAHSLAVIVVQADGGAYAASMDGDPETRLATAERALNTIRATAQDALGETRRLVGVLRSDEATELAPAAGLGEIFGLVEGLTDAGRDVRLEVTGDPALRRLLSPSAELAVYRIIQEALTNAVKHAGDAASVLVHLHHAPECLTVTVRDDGVGAGPSDGLGHGLVGMRERVSAFGGTLAAHDHPDGGFVVTATFPTTPPTSATPGRPGTPGTPSTQGAPR